MLINKYISLYYDLRVLGIYMKVGKRNSTGGKRGKWTEARTKAATGKVQSKEMSIRQANEDFLMSRKRK
jgi:hypothetical protein